MPIFENVSLKPLSYYKTGGLCAYLVQPESTEELQDSLRSLRKKNLPLFVLGGGTNSLVSDVDWEGIVVHLGRMNHAQSLSETSLRFGSGITNSEVAQEALRHSLKGASWMFRLPGQLGGTVLMNARCYGGEISQIVREISSVDHEGHLVVWKTTPDKKDVFHGYKHTIFMSQPLIITDVVIELSKGDPQSIEEEMLACERDRVSKHQFDFPSCGCVFKNVYTPAVSVPSGKLIEQAGMKGFRHGGAHVSEYHANFIFNDKNATSQEILELSELVRQKVLLTSGIELEYEMEVLGSV